MPDRRQGRAEETREAETAGRQAITLEGVRLTHPDRRLFDDPPVTKVDLARYYLAVSEPMLVHLDGRLVALRRCPRGVAGGCFLQRHPGSGLPAPISAARIREASGKIDDHLLIGSRAGLVAAVQMGTIELHIWGARVDDLERPDRLVFDLDPGPGLAFSAVWEAAVLLREELAALGHEAGAMITGGKGIHVIVPLRPEAPWDEVRAFARGFAEMLARRWPERFTASLPLARRQGRIFIDWLRNVRGGLSVAPWSVRARPGAPVATPVSWEELPAIPGARAFGFASAAARAGQGDPLHALAAGARPLSDAARRMAAEALRRRA